MVERVEAYPWVTVTLDKKNNRGTVGYNMIVLKKKSLAMSLISAKMETGLSLTRF